MALNSNIIRNKNTTVVRSNTRKVTNLIIRKMLNLICSSQGLINLFPKSSMSLPIVAPCEFGSSKPKVKQTIGANKILKLLDLHLMCVCYTASLVFLTLNAIEFFSCNTSESLLLYHLGDLISEDPP